MLKKSTFLLFMIFFTILHANAQNGFSDDFSSESISANWFTSNAYTLSQSAGTFKVHVDKSEGWASFGRSIPTLDLSASPIINMRVKTMQDVIVDLYLVDTSNKNYNVGRRISRADDFINICWDFTGITAVDLTKISQIYIAVNGMALTYIGDLEFDDLKIGTDAQKIPNFSGVPTVNVHQHSSKNTIYLQAIQNAESISFSATPSLITNIAYSPIVNGRMTITFDASSLTGTETLTLQSIGKEGWGTNTYSFTINVSGNNPPVFTLPEIFKCEVGKEQVIEIKGISDGDKAVRQDVSFSLTSPNAKIIGENESFEYNTDAPTAKLIFTPTEAGTVTATITATDGQTTNHTTSKQIQITTYNEWNEPPTLHDIAPVAVYNNAGEQSLILTGISSGDAVAQELSFELLTSGTGVITSPRVEYVSGTTAILKYTPVANKIGEETVSVKITDNGASALNNGNQSVQKIFTIDVQAPPLTGYIVPLTDYSGDRANKLWHVEVENTGQTISYEKDNSEDVLHINCTAKSTWNGLWYGFNKQKLDLLQNPYITLWVKSDTDIQFTLYMWDYKYERNNIAVPDVRSIPANTWTKVTYDFYGKMVNELSKPIAADRIDSLLFNYHPVFSWPFTNFKGNVWIKDIRIGDKADDTFSHPKLCTIDDMPSVSVYSNATNGSVELNNISNGNKGAAVVTATSSNTAIISNPEITAVVDGKATLNYALTGTPGTATVSVTVSADGSTSTVKTFTVNVVAANPTNPATVTVDLNTRYQTMRGIGTFVNNGTKPYFSQYVDEFGASVARVGVISNHLEPVNDNDDPFVLDRNNLDYSAFDWDFYKKLHENGVKHFILTVWSMPAWMKENASDDFFMASPAYWEGNPNRVDTLMYDEYVENIVATIRAFKENAGIDLYGVSLQNEPSFNEPYASAVISPRLLVKLINMTGKRFAAEGINCRIYMAEQVLDMPVYPWNDYLTAVQKDPDAWKYTDVQAVHGYAANGITAYNANCTQWNGYKNLIEAAPHPKEFWMTETEPVTTKWDDILENILAMNTAFSCGNVSLWSQWGFASNFITQAKSNQLVFAQSQYAKFVKPGSVRVSSISSNADVLVSSFANTAEYNKNLATVVVNKSASPVSIKLTGANIPEIFDTYQTCYLQNFKKTTNGAQKDVAYLLPAKSITTFVAALPNAAPTIDAVVDQVIVKNAPEQVVTLSGITDGGEGDQVVSLTPVIESGNNLISNVRIEYNSPEKTAKLYYTPVTDKAGNASVKIEVADNGLVNNKTYIKCNIQIQNVTGLKSTKDVTMNVYPNPVDEFLIITLPDVSYKSVDIINVMGEIVHTQYVNSEYTRISVDKFHKGVYFIVARSENKVITKQFLKK